MLKTWICLSLLSAGCLYGQYSNGRQSITLNLPTVSQHAISSQRIGLTDITVTYSRPLVNGRKIWGDTVKYGEVWRAGANENTTFAASDTVMVEGKPLAAGTYGFHMIPGQDTWTVIFSKNYTSWGSFSYKEEEDALRVTVKARATDLHEALTYEFDALHPDSAELAMKWEKVAVPVSLSVDTKATTISAIKNQLRNLAGYGWMAWDDGAEWLLDQKSDLELALKWANQSTQIQPVFHNLQTKSRILTALGRKDEAAATMQLAIKGANAAQIYTYARGLQQEGKQQEAIAAFREAGQKDPSSWIAHMAMARVHSADKRFPDAVKEARLALEGAPQVQKSAIEAYVGRLEKGQDINQ